MTDVPTKGDNKNSNIWNLFEGILGNDVGFWVDAYWKSRLKNLKRSMFSNLRWV